LLESMVAHSLRSDSTLDSKTAPGKAYWTELKTSLAVVKKRPLL